MNLNFNIPGIKELLDALRRLAEALTGRASEAAEAADSAAGDDWDNFINPKGKPKGRPKTTPKPNKDPFGALSDMFSQSSRRWMRIMGAAIRAFQTGSAYAIGAFASIAASAGLVGLAFFSLALAAVGLGKALKFAVSEGVGYVTRRSGSGATKKEQAILDSMATVLGMDKAQLSNIAGSQPGFATGFLQQMEYLRTRYPNAGEDQIGEIGRVLRMMNLPAELAKLFVMDKTTRDDAFAGRIGNIDPDKAVDAVRAEAQWNQMKEKFITVFRDVAMSVMSFFVMVKDFFDSVNQWLNDRLSFLDNVWGGDFLKRAIKSVIPALGPFLGVASTESTSQRQQATTVSRLEETTKRFESATNKFGSAVDAFAYTNKSGIFGGIDVVRASRAFPTNGAWSWNELRKRQMDDQMYLGAFTI